MKKMYLRPAMEVVKVQGEEMLASSNGWSENGATGDFPLNDGTATNPISETKDFSFWSHHEAW